MPLAAPPRPVASERSRFFLFGLGLSFSGLLESGDELVDQELRGGPLANCAPGFPGHLVDLEPAGTDPPYSR